jgi:hypothetical protein
MLDPMDERVRIVCDGLAGGITGGAVPGSYLMSAELKEDGGAYVVWTDLPEQGIIFDDRAAASAFCREHQLTDLFDVSFALVVSLVPPWRPQSPAPAPAGPVSLAGEMRAMGLM